MTAEALTPVFGNFTDQKPHVVTEGCLGRRWGGGGLRCALCGHKAKAGDLDADLFDIIGEPWECVIFRDYRAVDILRDQLIPTFLAELRKADAEAA